MPSASLDGSLRDEDDDGFDGNGGVGNDKNDNDIIDDDSDEDNETKKFTLPWWCRHLAWLMCVTTAIMASYWVP